MRTSPPSGRSKSPAICSSVDFPAPDGPTKATISPGFSARSMPLSTARSTPPWRYTRLTPASSSAGFIPGGSFVAQPLDRVEPRRPPCRVERGEERQRQRHDHHGRDLPGDDLRRNAGEVINLGGKHVHVQHV